MPAISLKAHFDGQTIQLDEPYELPRNAQLLVTVLSESTDELRSDWSELATAGLLCAYGGEEPEYSAADILP